MIVKLKAFYAHLFWPHHKKITKVREGNSNLYLSIARMLASYNVAITSSGLLMVYDAKDTRVVGLVSVKEYGYSGLIIFNKYFTNTLIKDVLLRAISNSVEGKVTVEETAVYYDIGKGLMLQGELADKELNRARGSLKRPALTVINPDD